MWERPAQSKYVREENLAQQVKEAILKVALDDGLFSPMMKELEREKTLRCYPKEA